MNAKNIKKSLNVKLAKWLENIDEDDIKKIIKENTIVTGGALVSMLTGDEIRDYDVYFRTRDAVLKVANYYAKKFNEAHQASVIVEEKEDGKIKVFIQSAGVASESEDTETITDESEPIEPKTHDEQTEEHQKYRPVYLTSNAITLSDKIQIVIRFWGEIEEIHKIMTLRIARALGAHGTTIFHFPSMRLNALLIKNSGIWAVNILCAQ